MTAPCGCYCERVRRLAEYLRGNALGLRWLSATSLNCFILGLADDAEARQELFALVGVAGEEAGEPKPTNLAKGK